MWLKQIRNRKIDKNRVKEVLPQDSMFLRKPANQRADLVLFVKPWIEVWNSFIFGKGKEDKSVINKNNEVVNR